MSVCFIISFLGSQLTFFISTITSLKNMFNFCVVFIVLKNGLAAIYTCIIAEIFPKSSLCYNYTPAIKNRKMQKKPCVKPGALHRSYHTSPELALNERCPIPNDLVLPNSDLFQYELSYCVDGSCVVTRSEHCSDMPPH